MWPTCGSETDSLAAPHRVVRGFLEVEESLEVVTGGYQGPFKAGLFQTAQHEAPETYSFLDDAKYRFHCFLAQTVEFLAFGGI